MFGKKCETNILRSVDQWSSNYYLMENWLSMFEYTLPKGIGLACLITREECLVVSFKILHSTDSLHISSSAFIRFQIVSLMKSHCGSQCSHSQAWLWLINFCGCAEPYSGPSHPVVSDGRRHGLWRFVDRGRSEVAQVWPLIQLHFFVKNHWFF